MVRENCSSILLDNSAYRLIPCRSRHSRIGENHPELTVCHLMLQSRPLAMKSISPHRLVAQDEALSRLKLEFESPWGHCPTLCVMQGFIFLGAGMQEKSRNSSRGYLIGLSATVFLSFTGILISYLNRVYNLPSLVLAFWRDCFVALGLDHCICLIQTKSIPT